LVLLQLALKANKAIHLLLVMETARAVGLGLQLPESLNGARNILIKNHEHCS